MRACVRAYITYVTAVVETVNIAVLVVIIFTLMIISIRSSMGACDSIVVFTVSAIVVVVDEMVVSY